MVDRVFILRYHRCLAQAQPDVLCATRLNGSVEAYYHVGNAATPPKETAAALMGASSILMLEAYHHEIASPRLRPASALLSPSFPSPSTTKSEKEQYN
ncbi:hypothetical protein O988_03356 [Pseudogymnoascus sp. VKM F-3808]|nr:hypothetical protein O988_03356 [Pseudogymnoascus sp. VKM F-3808]